MKFSTFGTILALSVAVSMTTAFPVKQPCQSHGGQEPIHPGARTYPSEAGGHRQTGNVGNHGHHGGNHGGQGGHGGHGNHGGHGVNPGPAIPSTPNSPVTPVTPVTPTSSPVPPPGSSISLEETEASAVGNNTLSVGAEEDRSAVSANTEDKDRFLFGAAQPGSALGFNGLMGFPNLFPVPSPTQ